MQSTPSSAWCKDKQTHCIRFSMWQDLSFLKSSQGKSAALHLAWKQDEGGNKLQLSTTITAMPEPQSHIHYHHSRSRQRLQLLNPERPGVLQFLFFYLWRKYCSKIICVLISLSAEHSGTVYAVTVPQWLTSPALV